MIEYENESYLNVDEAAKTAGISVAYFRLLRKRCDIAAYYFPMHGNKQFFRRRDIGTILKPVCSDFTTRDGKKQVNIRRKEVFNAIFNGRNALNNLVCKRFKLLDLGKGDTAITRAPAVLSDIIQNEHGAFKKGAADRYGAITLNHKGGSRKEIAKNESLTEASPVIPVRLDKYALLVILELIERAQKEEDETVATNVFKINKNAPDSNKITMDDFAEMARRIYGRNDKDKRRMVFDKIRSLAFTEFTTDIPSYFHDNEQFGIKKKMIRVHGTLFSYSYCTQPDEQDNGDAHEMYLSLAQIFYYLAHKFYAKLNIRNIEKEARKKDGGIVLRAALLAACNQPERVMHYKHDGDSYTLKIPYSDIFNNYEYASNQNRYHLRQKVTDEVLENIKNITAANNVNKDNDRITISFVRKV